MASIEVDDEGLSRLAHLCETHAVCLGDIPVRSIAVDGFQPSAAAVGVAHGAVVEVAARLKERLRATAQAVSAAYVQFGSTEASSAQTIAGLRGVTAI